MPRSCVLPTLGAAVVWWTLAGPASAGEVPPAVVATFTRSVQPLLLNKCGAGACHGGSQAPAPALTRTDTAGHATRPTTLANLREFLRVVGPERTSRRLLIALPDAHAGVTAGRRQLDVEFTPRERASLDAWLAAVRAANGPVRDGGVVPAAAEIPLDPPRSNRFQDLLEAAANPPALPPPQEPQGVIFPKDIPSGDDDPSAE